MLIELRRATADAREMLGRLDAAKRGWAMINAAQLLPQRGGQLSRRDALGGGSDPFARSTTGSSLSPEAAVQPHSTPT